ncbi:hypothetical protein JXA40_12355 [bacterium]|nr:hypothetical protein [candidate division CSSED10-310 bacterium]
MKSSSKLLLMILVAVLPGCESWRSSPPDENHSITVTNRTECSLGILLDDADFLTLPSRNDFGVFDDVPKGDHFLAAYDLNDPGTDVPVAFVTIHISERKDYYWEVTGCP